MFQNRNYKLAASKSLLDVSLHKLKYLSRSKIASQIIQEMIQGAFEISQLHTRISENEIDSAWL